MYHALTSIIRADLLGGLCQVYNQAELQAAFTEGLTARSQLIADGGTKIGALLAESQTTVKTARASPEWRAYTEFIAAAVTEGLAAAAVAGLRFIQNQASLGQSPQAWTVAEADKPGGRNSHANHHMEHLALASLPPTHRTCAG